MQALIDLIADIRGRGMMSIAGSCQHQSAAASKALMSFTLHGVAVSGGIAIGHAHLVSHAALEVAHYVLPKALPEEIARFDAALPATRQELEALRSDIPRQRAGGIRCLSRPAPDDPGRPDLSQGAARA